MLTPLKMKRRDFLLYAGAAAGLAAGDVPAADADVTPPLPPIRGALRVHPQNSRYFTDDSGRAIYLTGSHLGWELQDDAWDKQITFDFAGYLDLLSRHRHNLIRLWSVEHTCTDKSPVDVVATPMPFVRSGPENALDGRPQFDLRRFDEAYFRRLRERTLAAQQRGIYVMVMLFQGWSNRVSKKSGANPWFGNVYNKSNNINGIDGDRGEGGNGAASHRQGDPELLEFQEAYVSKVVDTVNDLDNVLYEISNESLGSLEWHEHIAGVIDRQQVRGRKRHPIVISGCGDGLTNDQLLGSSADAVGLSGIGDRAYLHDPPESSGAKVVVHDTDHIQPKCRDPLFVWKNFLRGNHPIVLDWGLAEKESQEWNPIRRAMGISRSVSEQIDLVAMVPSGELCSSRYCLADRGREYLALVPDNTELSIDLSGSTSQYDVQWIDPRDGRHVREPMIAGGSSVKLISPLPGSALVQLKVRR
jgi:hypothetical protein